MDLRSMTLDEKNRRGWAGEIKSRDITLLTKVCTVMAMIFPVVRTALRAGM